MRDIHATAGAGVVPVAAFAGASNSPYMFGSLSRLAGDHDEATVMFGHCSPPARWATKACANLDAVSTPRSDDGRFDEA